MPNWCCNTVKIESEDKELLKRVTDEMRSEESCFDFNKLIPMPPESEKFSYDKCYTDEERERLEVDDWYNWSYKHWGVKWNAGDSKIIGDGEWWFWTAWCPPEGIIKELSRKYHCTVSCEFWIENWDEDEDEDKAHCFRYKNGEYIEDEE